MKNTNPSLICIVNNGKDIAPGTNFWDSPTAMAGKFIITTNAGCVRVLLPDAWLHQVPDMIKGAKHVVISVLDSYDYDADSGGIVLEFMIEDGGSSPFVLATPAGGVIGIPAPAKTPFPWTASIWGRKNGKIHKFMERPCYVRYASRFPCVDPFVPPAK